MTTQIATVSTKGQLVIPAEVRTLLGIHPGSRVAITVEQQRIIIRPVTDRLVDDTAGMLRGGPSLADELQKERRKEKW